MKTDVISYLKQHENKEYLRFITCGSVDDGKSTLIGRLLYESKMVFEDHLMALQAEKKYKRTTDEIDFSLLVDGLQAEREQGITIDVAYRYFSTEKRKFIIADTPGHEEYTRNMVTGASNADLAIILIDAKNGVLTQTKRHTFLAYLLGIRHMIVAINKMDIVDYSKSVFERIKTEYTDMFRELENSVYQMANYFEGSRVELHFVPISALKGDNVIQKSDKMSWFKDNTLMEKLENIEITHSESKVNQPFRMPVQYVNRPDQNFRGYCGSIASGQISEGDDIIILPSEIKTKVKSIIPAVFGGSYEAGLNLNIIQKIKSASYPMSITIETDDNVDISRGNMITKTGSSQETRDAFDAFVIWFESEKLKTGNIYDIKRATTKLYGSVEKIHFKVDVNNLQKLNAQFLKMNEIAYCRIKLSAPIAYDDYHNIKQTGSFIFINRFTNNTSGAGIIFKSERELGQIPNIEKNYSDFEVELNKLIRKFYPEWNCREV